jgi:hypothetical protein
MYDFNIEPQIRIPKDSYLPYKRCDFCQSVYLTDNICETCGRSVRFDPIGPAFGYKSYFGIKERYKRELPAVISSYPILENINSPRAKSLVRQLQKRLGDLATLVENDQQKKFELEGFEIINDLIFYGVSPVVISSIISDHLPFENYLAIASERISAKKNWVREILSFRLWGILRVGFILTTLTLLAFIFTGIIFSLRSGK